MRSAELAMQRGGPCGEVWSGGRHGVTSGRLAWGGGGSKVWLVRAAYRGGEACEIPQVLLLRS